MFSPAPAREAPARRVFHALGTVLRGETGFPQADVENDFLRARRRQVADRLACSVRRRPASASRLVPLDEVVDALGRRGERRLGLQAIRLATIVGTLDARREFDHRFRPTSNRVRSRWERLALAQRPADPGLPGRRPALRRRRAPPSVDRRGRTPENDRRLRHRSTHHTPAL